MAESDESTAVEVVDPLVGTIFDKRFRVEERLAAGGFGAIYRATHVKSGHEIALKVLHPTLASDLGVLARFRREGTTLTALRNRHTITAYEFGQADKTLFIVMELLHGETLFDRFSTRGPMEWKALVRIAKQVCESLEEAHAQGIVHRDLKPTNIHLEEHDGDPDFVKVLDFGIAKILRGSDHDSSDITNAGQMIGTLDYMSPEQMVGGQVTGQTDIYTLGIVMYEMIAGTRPFPESQNASAALGAMLRTTPPPLLRRVPVPSEVDRVVMRCLERDTEKRYRSVAELRADLDRLVEEDAPSVVTATATVAVSQSFEDNDATRVSATPDKLLASMRSVGGRARKATAPADGEVDTPSAQSRSRSWDDDEVLTTTHRPEGYEDTVLAPHAMPAPAPVAKPMRGSAPKPAPALKPAAPASAPPLRPLASRHVGPQVPQLVVAPFSTKPAMPPDPAPHAAPSSSVPPAEPGPPVTGPHAPHPTPGPAPTSSAMPGFGPPQYQPHVASPVQGYGGGYPQAAPLAERQPYDMSGSAAHEAAVRRLVWIGVLVLAAIVGFALAMQL